MIGFGALVLLVGLNEMFKANATRQWRTTTGTVVTSTIGTVKSVRTFFWVPVISFTYQIGTKAYTSSRYSASTQTGFFIRRSLERILARHPLGSHVIVSYLPSDPENAILAPGIGPVFSSAMRYVLLAALILTIAFNITP
jgi:uncharacterized protein DUF3592